MEQGINFLRLIHPEIIIKEFTDAHHKENKDQFHKLQGQGTLFARDDKQDRDTIPMPTFAGKPSTMRFVNTGGNSEEFYVWTAKTTNIGAAVRQNPQSTIIFGVEDTMQKSSDHLTCSDFPSEAMLWIEEVETVDSVEELKSSRSVSGKNFPNFEMLDAKIACTLNKDHPEFHIQEESQSRGTESPERGLVSTRKTDRLHDLRLLSSDWCS